MGKHELPNDIHERHQMIRSALIECRRLVRDILIGGSAIWIFDPHWGLVSVSHHSDAFVWIVSNVTP